MNSRQSSVTSTSTLVDILTSMSAAREGRTSCARGRSELPVAGRVLPTREPIRPTRLTSCSPAPRKSRLATTRAASGPYSPRRPRNSHPDLYRPSRSFGLNDTITTTRKTRSIDPPLPPVDRLGVRGGSQFPPTGPWSDRPSSGRKVIPWPRGSAPIGRPVPRRIPSDGDESRPSARAPGSAPASGFRARPAIRDGQ